MIVALAGVYCHTPEATELADDATLDELFTEDFTLLELEMEELEEDFTLLTEELLEDDFKLLTDELLKEDFKLDELLLDLILDALLDTKP